MATLNELIETLQDLLGDYPELGDQAINVGYQANYPLAGIIANVVVIDGEDEETDEEQGCTTPQLWIAINDNHSEPYAPRAAWEHR